MPSRAGSSNKNKAYLLNRLKEMYGEDFHPILKMAHNAVQLQKIADDTYTRNKTEHITVAAKNAIEAWDKVAAYTEPKLKAIEHNMGEETRKAINMVRTKSTGD